MFWNIHSKKTANVRNFFANISHELRSIGSIHPNEEELISTPNYRYFCEVYSPHMLAVPLESLQEKCEGSKIIITMGKQFHSGTLHLFRSALQGAILYGLQNCQQQLTTHWIAS